MGQRALQVATHPLNWRQVFQGKTKGQSLFWPTTARHLPLKPRYLWALLLQAEQLPLVEVCRSGVDLGQLCVGIHQLLHCLLWHACFDGSVDLLHCLQHCKCKDGYCEAHRCRRVMCFTRTLQESFCDGVGHVHAALQLIFSQSLTRTFLPKQNGSD